MFQMPAPVDLITSSRKKGPRASCSCFEFSPSCSWPLIPKSNIWLHFSESCLPALRRLRCLMTEARGSLVWGWSFHSYSCLLGSESSWPVPMSLLPKQGYVCVSCYWFYDENIWSNVSKHSWKAVLWLSVLYTIRGWRLLVLQSGGGEPIRKMTEGVLLILLVKMVLKFSHLAILLVTNTH